MRADGRRRSWWALPALLLGCAHARPVPEGPGELDEQRARFEEIAGEMRAALLDRHTVPAPTLSFASQTREDAGLKVTVTPLLPEDQAWNAWPDGTARLFNDSVGYLWRVQVEADRPIQWSPTHTRLAVNDTDQVFPVAPVADELLMPLLQGAALEAALDARGDLKLRARAADEFRRAYLTTRGTAGIQQGVVVFPAPTRNIHAVAMELTVGLVVEGEGVREYRFLFE
ncbi:MAG: hypothetical protein NDJ72_12840 [Elusimicrobia bacterium]|nr:hypothetical protein [Elusimicrobiota bacterium]